MIFPKVFFKTTGDEAGKFLSLCRKNGISIKNFSKNSTVCTGSVAAKDYRFASRLARVSGIKLKITKKSGIYFYLKPYKKRTGLIFSGIGAIVLLLFLQNFVWMIEINGNDKVSDANILKVASDNGVKIGTFLPLKDLEKTELLMLKDLPSLSFISLNRIGSHIEIEVSEETPKPYIIDKNSPCNIVATKTARIISSEVYAGQKMFRDGDTVFEGDLLVSGIVETADGKSTYHHAMAKITAQTTFTKEFSIKLHQTERIYTGQQKNRYRILLFGKKLPLFIAFPLKGSCESEREMKPLKFLPLGIEKETIKFFEEKNISFTEKEALQHIEKSISEYEKESLSKAQIISREISAKADNNTFSCTIKYICNENIVSFVPIETDLDPDLPVNP